VSRHGAFPLRLNGDNDLRKGVHSGLRADCKASHREMRRTANAVLCARRCTTVQPAFGTCFKGSRQ
jgi:hypothetical protein